VRGGLPNELEERRVIRLLTGAAGAVPPLHDVEVETLVRFAARPSTTRLRRHVVVRRLPLLAAAAASVLAAMLPLRQHEPAGRPASASAGNAADALRFPEGSALSLLLARPSERRA
jgi:hypothetical protein